MYKENSRGRVKTYRRVLCCTARVQSYGSLLVTVCDAGVNVSFITSCFGSPCHTHMLYSSQRQSRGLWGSGIMFNTDADYFKTISYHILSNQHVFFLVTNSGELLIGTYLSPGVLYPVRWLISCQPRMATVLGAMACRPRGARMDIRKCVVLDRVI